MEHALGPASWVALLFDKTAKSPVGQIVELEQIDDLDPGEVLCCARCKTRITAPAARISVGGAYAHDFTNPGGFSFRIGCFSRVWNCEHVGGSSAEHTWFSGYTWQVVGCRGCGEHLGWRYARQEERFYGLILARLVPGADAGE